MTPTFFETAAQFRKWLQKHHRTAEELWVGFYKKGSGRPSITYPEALDEALCFGWIDGIRKSIDAERYTNRFTPRRKGSFWSAVNTRRATELIAAGRMRASGLAAFEARDEKKTAAFVSERQKEPEFDPRLEAQLRKNRTAWTFFQAQPPGYRKGCIRLVMSAKQDATRQRRLDIVIAHCAAGLRIDPMKPLKKPGLISGGG